MITDLKNEFHDKEARRQYAEDFLNAHIALQVKTLRQQRGWSQKKLAALAGKFQSQISEMESIDFASWKISTLLQLAEAFDLALTVNFESFGRFLEDVTRVGREALERPSFDDDPAFKEANISTSPSLNLVAHTTSDRDQTTGRDSRAIVTRVYTPQDQEWSGTSKIPLLSTHGSSFDLKRFQPVRSGETPYGPISIH
jgi:transcriptional regulator with XRE-family HTH domain